MAGVSDFCSVESELKSCFISPFTAIKQPFYASSTSYVMTSPLTFLPKLLTVHGLLEFPGGPLGEMVQWNDLICTLYNSPRFTLIFRGSIGRVGTVERPYLHPVSYTSTLFVEFQVAPWESWYRGVTLFALCLTVHGFLEFLGGPLGELVQWSDLICTLYLITVHGLLEFSGGPLGELVQWSDLICTLYLLGHDLTITSETEQLQRLV